MVRFQESMWIQLLITLPMMCEYGVLSLLDVTILFTVNQVHVCRQGVQWVHVPRPIAMDQFNIHSSLLI